MKNNCKFNDISEEESRERYDYYACDDCHRKSMGWELSYDTAEEIAENILREANKFESALKELIDELQKERDDPRIDDEYTDGYDAALDYAIVKVTTLYEVVKEAHNEE